MSNLLQCTIRHHLVRRFIGAAVTLFLCASAIHSNAETFLIQDRWGGIIGISRTASGDISDPELVYPMSVSDLDVSIVDLVAFPEGGYQLTDAGAVIPIGYTRPLPYSGASRGGAKALAVSSRLGAGWMAVPDYIRRLGPAPQLVLPPMLNQGIPITALVYLEDREELAILFQNGAIAVCSSDGYAQFIAPIADDDAAIAMAHSSDGFAVLTRASRIYLVDEDGVQEYPHPPVLEIGLARDLKASPFGEGYYVLDAFGKIHACGDAPPIPTEPLTADAAVALEIVPGDSPPNWTPVVHDAQVRLSPSPLYLHPDGSSRQVALVIERANNIVGFDAEIHYNPAQITVDPKRAHGGEWWQRAMTEPLLRVSADTQSGVVKLSARGTFTLFGGASGSGEAATLMVSAAPNMREGEAELTLRNAYLIRAYPGQPQAVGDVHSATVVIRAIDPRCGLRWRLENAEERQALRPGDVIRVDIVSEHGGRIQHILFGFEFSTETLRFLGMVPGDRKSVV